MDRPLRIVYEGREYILDPAAIQREHLQTLKRFRVKDLRGLAARVAEFDNQAIRLTYYLMLVLNGEKGVRLEDVNPRPVKLVRALAAASAEMRGS